MQLNTLKPAAGAKFTRKRVGRGYGSGRGGTAGRGDKGQKSRSGGYHKVGFEGGQMPLQRRLPKRGFSARVNRHMAEVRLHELAAVDGDIADLTTLKQAGVVALHITHAKIILSGEISRPITVRELLTTCGAKIAIEQAGGTVESVVNPATAKKLTAKLSDEKPASKSLDDKDMSGKKPVAKKVTGGKSGTDKSDDKKMGDAKSSAKPSANKKVTKKVSTKKSSQKSGDQKPASQKLDSKKPASQQPAVTEPNQSVEKTAKKTVSTKKSAASDNEK